jgi:hypothetical protein
MFLVDTTGVNVIIISLIIFVMILFLIADLIDTYLESQGEYLDVDLFGRKYDNYIKSKQNLESIPDSERKFNNE